jgi:hypothetical protein
MTAADDDAGASAQVARTTPSVAAVSHLAGDFLMEAVVEFMGGLLG